MGGAIFERRAGPPLDVGAQLSRMLPAALSDAVVDNGVVQVQVEHTEQVGWVGVSPPGVVYVQLELTRDEGIEIARPKRIRGGLVHTADARTDFGIATNHLPTSAIE